MAEDNRIDSTKVHYLSFEGGGGKGNAFLGAIKALEDIGILDYDSNGFLSPDKIKGIAGASAGAITAVLLAAGYNFDSIKKILTTNDFFKFFDGPNPGRKVMAYHNKSKIKDNIDVYNGYLENKNMFIDKLVEKIIKFSIVATFFDRTVGLLGTSTAFIIKAILKNPAWFIQAVIEHLKEQKDSNGNSKLKLGPAETRILKILLENDLNKFIDCLILDKGIFEGVEILKFFNEKIDANIRKYNKLNNISNFSGEHWWNFEEFYYSFKIDLKFTSVNFRTGNLQILSKDTTPKLPVAFATRMSMSLPLIFKPIIITEEFSKQIGFAPKDVVKGKDYKKEKDIWEGWWVDGGYFDNAPVRLFPKDETILLRLGDRSADKNLVEFTSFMAAYLEYGFLGSGGGQTTATTFDDNNIIELNVDGLGLLDFSPPIEIIEKLILKNNEIVVNACK